MEAAARLGGQGGGESRSIRKVVAASFIGTTIEARAPRAARLLRQLAPDGIFSG